MSRPKYVTEFKALKSKRKISMLTAYDFSMASILNDTEIDAVLVGDSLSNVFAGHKDTLMINFDDIIYHTAAVSRAFDGIIVADSPFMEHLNKVDFYENVKMLMQAGAGAIKIEGASALVIKRINKLVDAGVPVMGHLGLTPQNYLNFGGYKYQGKTEETKKEILTGAKKLEEAGVFAIVLECIPGDFAKEITEMLSVPTIGIGSGTLTDGQILVINDMLNLTNTKVPSFVKKYADLNTTIKNAVESYIKDID